MLSVVENRGAIEIGQLPPGRGGPPIEIGRADLREPQNVVEARQLVGGQGRRVSSRTKVGRMVQTAIQRASGVVSGVLVAGLLAGTMLATPADAQIVPRNPQQVTTTIGANVQDVAQA